MVVPSFANSSAFSFPHMPVWAAIHLSSRVLVVLAYDSSFQACLVSKQIIIKCLFC